MNKCRMKNNRTMKKTKWIIKSLFRKRLKSLMKTRKMRKALLKSPMRKGL
jgi:hypothetical protein